MAGGIIQILIWVLIMGAAFGIFWWAFKRTGIVIPPPIMTIIIVVIAIVCLLFLASLATGGLGSLGLGEIGHSRC